MTSFDTEELQENCNVDQDQEAHVQSRKKYGKNNNKYFRAQSKSENLVLKIAQEKFAEIIDIVLEFLVLMVMVCINIA